MQSRATNTHRVRRAGLMLMALLSEVNLKGACVSCVCFRFHCKVPNHKPGVILAFCHTFDWTILPESGYAL